MGQLVEIVFENLTPSSQVAMLVELRELIPKGSFLETGSSHIELETVSLGKLCQLYQNYDNRVLSIDPDSIKILSVMIKSPRINLSKYDSNRFDVNMNFDIEQVKESSLNRLIEVLHEFASQLAKKIDIPNYYCGLDPAIDEDTRLFTGDKLGPYRFPD